MTTPTVPFTTAAEKLGGERLLYGLYALTVSHPVARTWYLAGVDLDADQLYAGSPAYQGLVEADGPIEAAGVLGGVSEGGRVSLALRDHLGSYRGQGPFRRFSDQFAEVVPGFSEPSDLDTGVLVVSLTWAGLTSADVLPLGRYVVVPGSKRLAGGRLTLECESDPRFHTPLPKRKITPTLWPNADESIRGRPIPLVFGESSRLPGLKIDTGYYLLAESGRADGVVEASTHTITIYAVTQDDATSLPALEALLVGSTEPQTETGGATSGGLQQSGFDWATSVFLSEGVFVRWVEIELARSVGSTLNGTLVISLEPTIGNVPTGTPVTPEAQVTLNPSTLTADGTFRWITFMFSKTVLLRAGRVYRIVARYVESQTVDVGTLFLRFQNSGTAPGSAGLLQSLASHAPPFRPFNVTDATIGEFNHKLHVAHVIGGEQEISADGWGIQAVKFATELGGAGVAVDAQIVADVRGLTDGVGGTYTGTALARITNGADVVRFLLLSRVGLRLDAARVDSAALTTARARLASWFPLAGVLDTDDDAMVWLQRVARCCRSAVFEDQDGRLTMATDGGPGPSPAPVRRVQYWEHGPLELGGPPEAAGMPWTLVEVFAGRQLVDPAPPTSLDAQRVGEWSVTLRHDASADLIARYGIRTNGGQIEPRIGHFVSGGPTESNTFYFVDSAADAQELLDWLVSVGAKRLDPWGVVSVVLPRFALGWRVMDEITLESQAFPSALDHAIVGQVHWAGATWDGGTVQWYQCRRGRFSMRGLGITPAHGPNLPVRATLKHLGWETA